MVDDAEMSVVWNARNEDPYDTRLPLLLSSFGRKELTSKIAIVVTPLRKGLFRVNVLNCCPSAITYGTIPD